MTVRTRSKRIGKRRLRGKRASWWTVVLSLCVSVLLVYIVLGYYTWEAPHWEVDVQDIMNITGTITQTHKQRYINYNIPARVHFIAPGPSVAKVHEKNLRTWKRLHPHFQYYLWTDATGLKLVEQHYPRLSKFYKEELANGMERADLLRLLVLHYIGGIYADLDVRLLRPVTSLVTNPNYSCILSQEPMEHAKLLYQRETLVSNAIILCQARHPFLRFLLNNFRATFYTRMNKLQSSSHPEPSAPSTPAADTTRRPKRLASYLTGPQLLTQLHDNYLKSFRYHDTTNEPVEYKVHLAAAEIFSPAYDISQIAVMRKLCGFHRTALRIQQACAVLRAREFAQQQPLKYTLAIHQFEHASYEWYVDRHDGSSLKQIQVCQILHCFDATRVL